MGYKDSAEPDSSDVRRIRSEMSDRFTIEEIKAYLQGKLMKTTHLEIPVRYLNIALQAAINHLEDGEVIGIKSVRKVQ